MPSTLENYLKGLISVVFILLSIHSIGQKTTIQDYVIFGGSGNYLNTGSWSEENEGCQVVIGNKSTITNGAIGSFQFIKTTGEVSIGGNVFSGGKISLSSKNTVSGKIAADNSSGYNGDILKTGSYGNFIGNINVNGNISIGSKSKVEGTVTLPSGSSYYGPAPKGGKIVGTLSLPGLPDMPPVTDFPTAGSKSIYGSETILPGAYNKIELKGYKTITFSGTGVYVFNSINNQGTNNFIFDFKNNSTGTVRLYIYGNVDLDNIKVQVINGGEASRIYTEVHGNGKSCWDKKSSWTMGGSWYCQKKESNWEGTVWAPYGPI
ncbi:MAG: polymer-forming cytoskeletal protein, partial [Ginsengibacter sp.]